MKDNRKYIVENGILIKNVNYDPTYVPEIPKESSKTKKSMFQKLFGSCIGN